MSSVVDLAVNKISEMADYVNIKQISDMMCDAFDNVMAGKIEGLTESMHAPKTDEKTRVAGSGQAYHVAPVDNPPTSSVKDLDFPACRTSSKPTRFQSNTTHKNQHTYTSDTSSKMTEHLKDFSIANVDDAVGFMAFARALREKQALEAAAASSIQTANVSDKQSENNTAWDAFSADETTSKESTFASDSKDAWPADPDSGKNNDFGDDFRNTNSLSMSGQGEDPETPKSSHSALNGGVPEFVPHGHTVLAPQNSDTATAAGASDSAPVEEEEEDRENLTTFKTWGTPVSRGKPTAQVRRVIIKQLPASWSSPAKVLSLIHGGMVESMSISPSGNAHVLFCDHEACKAFYDRYPNGIDLNKDKRKTVFVEMGTEVDVISSQLSFNLSIGSSRVVRAVGVDLTISMRELLELATSNNRKVEKIIDLYVPGDARSVVFHFCSIDDAVKFRAAILRNADWEHCNIQHASDPCELAIGFHAD